MTTDADDPQPTADTPPIDTRDKSPDESPTVILPPISGVVPRRDSVIQRGTGPITLPSGRVARPVAEYLEADPDAAAVPGPFESPSADASVDARQEAWASGPQVVSPSGGVSRTRGGGPRIPRWALFGGIGAIVLILAIIVMANGGKSSPAVTVSLTASPTTEPVVVGFFDDGIADEDYPPLAADRGPDYPDAFTMEDWVWDRVGPGWAVVIYSGWQGWNDATDSPSPAPQAVAYLNSPEGASFELVALPDRVADGASLVSWHEDARTARITWGYEQGGMLDLTTGEVDDTSFSMSAGRTKIVHAIAVNAEGTELWMALANDYTEARYFAWDGADGWNEAMTAQSGNHLQAPQRSPDSSLVALSIPSLAASTVASDASLPPGVANFMVYALSDGSVTQFVPGVGSEESPCWTSGFQDSTGVVVGCYDDATGDYESWLVELDDEGSVTPYEYTWPWFAWEQGKASGTSPEVPLELVFAPDDSRVTAINVRTEAGYVPLVDMARDLGVDAANVSSVTEVAPGAFRIATWEGYVLGIDTTTATFAGVIVARGTLGPTVVWPKYVFYGEATPTSQLWTPEGGY